MIRPTPLIRTIALLSLLSLQLSLLAQRRTDEQLLRRGWAFARGDIKGAEAIDYDDSRWQRVEVPHDWAIYGPFSGEHDKQNTAIKQDGQSASMEHTCRTGGLPFVGIGWYRRTIDIDQPLAGKIVELGFDGAMSHCTIYINGQKIYFHPYGYSPFFLDITPYVHQGKNALAVRLDNKPESSRWYPGAGLYRHVGLRILPRVHFATRGTHIYTDRIKGDTALLSTSIAIEGLKQEEQIILRTQIRSTDGQIVYREDRKMSGASMAKDNLRQIAIASPLLWSPDKPNLYTAELALMDGSKVIDAATVRFGIRTVNVKIGVGILLNDSVVRFRGVCLHHDLGPLGAAVHRDAMLRQIKLMKDMGANAIRTAHNMPDPGFVELCDSLGMMLMCESFDEWRKPKMANGYHRSFDSVDSLSGEAWWRKDLGDMIRLYRSSPSIIMWSIGNEIEEQGTTEGAALGLEMQTLCHRLDPSRPVTMGLNGITYALRGGLAQQMDVPGVNYNLHDYGYVYNSLPQGFLLATETCSTVSSRDVYKFPVARRAMHKHPDGQSSSYDVETVNWGNLPDDDFLCEDEQLGYIGQFIWTGIDYLGEPTPYYSDWPNHSSHFGAVDLAGLPKDRFYLYRSRWNEHAPTLHLLPHWTFPGREGEITPVLCYTSYPEAELFVNGRSQGRRRFDSAVHLADLKSPSDDSLLTRQNRYRLIWPNIRYEAGTLRIVAYQEDGTTAAEQEIHTAERPYAIRLDADTTVLDRAGESLVYVTASIVDRHGTLCPEADRDLSFEPSGAVVFRAAANGNVRSLAPFHLPHHHTFAGKAVIVLSSKDVPGDGSLTVRSQGLRSATIRFRVR